MNSLKSCSLKRIKAGNVICSLRMWLFKSSQAQQNMFFAVVFEHLTALIDVLEQTFFDLTVEKTTCKLVNSLY